MVALLLLVLLSSWMNGSVDRLLLWRMMLGCSPLLAFYLVFAVWYTPFHGSLAS
jgi:hypothetical protein